VVSGEEARAFAPSTRAEAIGGKKAPGGSGGVKVEIEGVTRVFRGSKRGELHALGPIDLEVSPGEFVALVGPSGCGKSTLLSIIAGLSAPTAGEVRIDGVVVRGAFDRLGMVFQKDLLLPWRNAIDNVLVQAEVRGLKRRDYEQRARELLDLVGIGSFAESLPSELSGGMRQRVAVCRALLHDPPLLLLDEAFTALDAITRDQLAVDFQRLCSAGTTVLFVTHDVTEAVLLGDRVVVMSPRPGRMADVLTVDLPRPRPLSVRESERFVSYTRHVREVFELVGVLRDAT
jgi:NitT/TauT family transport system ATP-binding protein